LQRRFSWRETVAAKPVRGHALCAKKAAEIS